MCYVKKILNGYITEIAIGELFFNQSQVRIGKKSVYQSELSRIDVRINHDVCDLMKQLIS